MLIFSNLYVHIEPHVWIMVLGLVVCIYIGLQELTTELHIMKTPICIFKEKRRSKLSNPSKRDKKNLDRSMRLPISDLGSHFWY